MTRLESHIFRVFLIVHQVRVLERRSVSEDSVCVSILSRGDSFGDRTMKG